MVKSMVVTVAVLVSCVLPLQGREFEVGGEETSWKLPSSSSVYSQWAQRNRFLVGDVLVWKYDGKSDSVLEVTKQDYDECNTWRPIATYEDGNTKMTLKHSGAFYFISGAEGHCQKGQKVEVIVLSQHHGATGPAVSPAIEPAPAALSPTPAAHEESSASAQPIARWIVSVIWIGIVMA
ncbi:hypothetical protein MLD38_014944 [Melastoma candidum]|uniref:Uncharacterized protein n=1 Tax=Melastoma candidum TaxID=119954 RepID=A0ACB9RHI0_9MYRT|nr:hypothetical protein MLD38_014944 [Melastoma candidum]